MTKIHDLDHPERCAGLITRRTGPSSHLNVEFQQHEMDDADQDYICPPWQIWINQVGIGYLNHDLSQQQMCGNTCFLDQTRHHYLPAVGRLNTRGELTHRLPGIPQPRKLYHGVAMLGSSPVRTSAAQGTSHNDQRRRWWRRWRRWPQIFPRIPRNKTQNKSLRWCRRRDPPNSMQKSTKKSTIYWRRIAPNSMLKANPTQNPPKFYKIFGQASPHSVPRPGMFRNTHFVRTP